LKRAAGEDESHRGSSQSSTNVLSVDSLAKLDALNEKDSYANKEKDRKERAKKEKIIAAGRVNKEKVKSRKETGGMTRRRRNITGELEEGRGTRGGLYDAAHTGQKKKRCWLLLACFAVLLLVILIPVGVLVIGKQNSNSSDPTPTSSTPANGSLSSIDPSDIPTSAKGGPLDPFTWYDTQDFNITYTDETVGGLFVMGLNSTWDDSIRANQYVPPLNETFKYGTMPIRGVNLGGWLSLEPFITPSMFNTYDPKFGIVDEWTLTSHLGPSQAAQTLEKHYSTFINKQSFADIQAAGFDHVRIPYSYWAVTTYDGDPYVPKISWRYLLRAIEYARMFGIRVNLDLHGLPGSQNGWNHSGRQGAIGWLNGTDGSLNAQRALDIHGQLSTFFAQPRYANVVGIYGLVNEPKMISLPTQPVLDWTTSAVSIIRKNGLTQTIAFGDGFLGLPNWKGKLSGLPGLVLDAHNYVIFNVNQIAFNHQSKLNFACSGWAGQMSMSINTATGLVSRVFHARLVYQEFCPLAHCVLMHH
jgi:glucan 1,3-beta-glucosidase